MASTVANQPIAEAEPTVYQRAIGASSAEDVGPEVVGRDRAGLLAVQLRLGVLCLTAVSLPGVGSGRWLMAAAVGMAAVSSFALVLWWERLGSELLGHPSYLALEIFLVGLVLAIAGPSSPFVYFGLVTAFLGGLYLTRVGAAAVAVALLGVYFAALGLHRVWVDAFEESFHALVGQPVLILIAAAAGVAARALRRSQAETERQLRAASAEAASERERNRLARELHDSFAKSLHGIAMSAEALTVTATRSPERVQEMAQSLADRTRSVSTDARSMLVDLRTSPVEGAEVHRLLADELQRWQTQSGTGQPGFELVERIEPVPPIGAATARELVLVARELLRNVERHAEANLVEVSLTIGGGQLALTVRDDGRGTATAVATTPSIGGPGANPRFGMVGMAERMQVIGGSLHVHSQAGVGTAVTALAPLGANETYRTEGEW